MSKYRVFSFPYFPVFSPNTGKYGPKKTPYLDTFHAVTNFSCQVKLVYHPIRLRYFLDISQHPKILKSYVVWQLVRQLVYTMFISNNCTSFHLWWKENLLNIKKSQNFMKVVVDASSYNFKIICILLRQVIFIK